MFKWKGWVKYQTSGFCSKKIENVKVYRQKKGAQRHSMELSALES